MRSIQAIIYDVDGTLVDTEPIHNRAWDEALQIRDSSLSSLSDVFIQQMAGKKPVVIASDMVNKLKLKTTAEQLLADKTNIYQSLVKTQLKPMAGAVESVLRFKEHGFQLAIGTSLDRQFLDGILKKLGIEDMFDTIVTGDQIKKGKPDPETYLKVLQELHVAPEKALVFEDAESGIKAAKAAGTWCIAIASNQNVKQNTELTDRTIASLSDATLEVVLGLS